MVRFIALFLLFILPLIFVPFIPFGFETPKVVIAELLIETGIVITVLKKDFSLRHFHPTQLKLILALIILAVFQSMLGPTDFLGNVFRHQGVFLLWHLLLWSLMATQFDLKIPKNLPLITLVLLLTSSAFLLGGNQAGRAFGTLGEPNALATTTVFILPFLLFNLKWFYPILGAILAFGIIFLSGSRSGLEALLTELLFLILIKIRLATTKAFAVCLILLAISLTTPLIEGGSWFENRAEVWQTALQSGLESPLFGHGFGNMEQAFHETAVRLNNNIQYQVVDSAHNFLLDWWVQGGTLGLVIFLSTLSLSLKNLLVRHDLALLAASLGLLVSLSFNPVSVVNLAAFWWLIGQGFKTSQT
ncbi:O-antigen ligase family protein [Candidatus Microgenomates bacterium]|nr:O-antigen ligase family protein [Candidatus Microgenomates bacterium]